jgi:hypothetical protein
MITGLSMAWHGMAWDNMIHIATQQGVEWDYKIHITTRMMAWPSMAWHVIGTT